MNSMLPRPGCYAPGSVFLDPPGKLTTSGNQARSDLDLLHCVYDLLCKAAPRKIPRDIN